MKQRTIKCHKCGVGEIKINYEIQENGVLVGISKCSKCKHQFDDFDSLFNDKFLSGAILNEGTVCLTCGSDKKRYDKKIKEHYCDSCGDLWKTLS